MARRPSPIPTHSPAYCAHEAAMQARVAAYFEEMAGRMTLPAGERAHYADLARQSREAAATWERRACQSG